MIFIFKKKILIYVILIFFIFFFFFLEIFLIRVLSFFDWRDHVNGNRYKLERDIYCML